MNERKGKFREFVEVNIYIYIVHEVRLLQFLRSEHVLSKTVMKLAKNTSNKAQILDGVLSNGLPNREIKTNVCLVKQGKPAQWSLIY